MGRRRRETTAAATADRYELYQLAVQDAESEVDFMTGIYRAARGRDPRHLREDFSGTALVTSHWIRRGHALTAEAYDIDPEPVAWGTRHNFAPRELAQGRARLLVADVREPSRKPPDLRCALNFSYRTFKARSVLVDYFRKVRGDLAEGGIFVLDVHGGPESHLEQTEVREVEPGFTYEWQQAAFWPATGDCECWIHFAFPDGSRLEGAFRYDWRLWSVPELADALADAGFADVRSYWEGTDDDGESGNDEFTEDERGENCLSWIAYLAAFK